MILRRKFIALAAILSAACYLQLFLLIGQTDLNNGRDIIIPVRSPDLEEPRRTISSNGSMTKDTRESGSLSQALTRSWTTGNNHVKQPRYRNFRTNLEVKNAVVNNTLVSRTKPMVQQFDSGRESTINHTIANDNDLTYHKGSWKNPGVKNLSGIPMTTRLRNQSAVKQGADPEANFLVKQPQNGTESKQKQQIVDKKLRELDAESVLLKAEIDHRKIHVSTTRAPSHRCHRNVHLWANAANELGYRKGKHLIDCPRSVCDVQLTLDMDVNTMQENEALVLFHWSSWDWEKLHSFRPPGQKWVFYTLESPRHTRFHVIPPDKYYNTSYDYIMTFRYDSDFRADYGQYRAGIPELEVDDNQNWAENRTKLVAWMASNCRGTTWPRMDFVQRLSRHIPVDMYGKCGNLSCPPGTQECKERLKQYKFYLALENSECTDYITEKFWIQALVRGLVPIVYGPPRSDYEKVAPPNSFIHIQDFATTKELAAYLQRVDEDDALYNAYFQWKKVGSLKPYGTEPSIFCQLGDRLTADERALQAGTYVPSPQKDWKVWWGQSCRRLGDIPE
ncbi:uncharacterized protein LOC121417790 [Lytechinus variegatus]|uniref:uncharacterized protein LOC121417790 n=1 Tax=Lytechinus variegatus TaxID=7654 RepID=UPI001BB244F2|nr:uncharacterized protein LOC121417790 [Lytechinus variegatus]